MTSAKKTVEEKVTKTGDDIKAASTVFAFKAGQMWRQASQKLRGESDHSASAAPADGAGGAPDDSGADEALDHNDHDGSSNDNYRI